MKSTIEFHVGSRYANENGVYTVKEIHDNKLIVQYIDGKTTELSANIQNRIIQNRGAKYQLDRIDEVLKEKGWAQSLPTDIDRDITHPPSNNQRNLKPDFDKFKEIIEANNITCLYHCTDHSNLESIKKHGFLFSWFYSERAQMRIPCPGGDELSRQLDFRKGLEDYVRLSFRRGQPMIFVANKAGKIPQPFDLIIDPQVVYWQNTLFSDRNATDNTACVGGGIEDFKKVRFDLLTRSWQNNEEKKLFQAEILVKAYLPIEYIKNL